LPEDTKHARVPGWFLAVQAFDWWWAAILIQNGDMDRFFKLNYEQAAIHSHRLPTVSRGKRNATVWINIFGE